MGYCASSGVAPVLERAGITPISPPIAAPDFRLPTLAGSELSLSENPGRWVLLTFFATWCGPCKTEMPSLQRFHEKFSSRGLDVFGVSTDSSVGVVKPFARSFKLSFPIGVDTEGRVASLYQASSIPVSYLITPAGTIAGVARGARDWSRLDSMVDGLLAAIPPNPEAQVAFTSNATPVELPTVLSPPTADYVLSTHTATAGDTLTLDILITWAGHFQDYLLHPPKVPIPDGVVQRSMTAHTSSEDGRKLVRYRYTLHTPTPGSYALDPIELRYTPRLESEPLASRVAGPTLKVNPGASRGPALAALLGLLGLCVGIGMFIRRRRKTPRVTGSPEGASPSDLKEQLRSARQLRHEGDICGFIEHLLSLDHHLGSTEESSAPLTALLPRVQYGGYRPSPQELDSLHRRIELRITELIPPEIAREQELISQTHPTEGVKS